MLNAVLLRWAFVVRFLAKNGHFCPWKVLKVICFSLRYKKNRVTKKSALCQLHWGELSQFCNETFHHSRCSDIGSGGISSSHEHRSDLNAHKDTSVHGDRCCFRSTAWRLSQKSCKYSKTFRTETVLNLMLVQEKKLLIITDEVLLHPSWASLFLIYYRVLLFPIIYILPCNCFFSLTFTFFRNHLGGNLEICSVCVTFQ